MFPRIYDDSVAGQAMMCPWLARPDTQRPSHAVSKFTGVHVRRHRNNDELPGAVLAPPLWEEEGGTAGHWSQNVADPRENFVGHVVIYAVLGLAYNVAIQMIFVPHAMAAVVRYIYSNILSHGENVGIS